MTKSESPKPKEMESLKQTVGFVMVMPFSCKVLTQESKQLEHYTLCKPKAPDSKPFTLKLLSP